MRRIAQEVALLPCRSWSLTKQLEVYVGSGLKDINACFVVTTRVDLLGEITEEHRREFRVTRRAVKQMVRDEATDTELGTTLLEAYGLVTRSDDFLGIEIIRSEGAAYEIGLLEFQDSLVERLADLSAAVPKRLRSQNRPMTPESHGHFVEQLQAIELFDERDVMAWNAGVEGLTRSLELTGLASSLGVQWAKGKMLEARIAANLAFVLT